MQTWRSIGLAFAAAFTFCITARAAEPEVLKVWPDKAPGESGTIGPEGFQPPNPKDAKPIQRLTNVTVPTLTVYRPAADKANGACVVIAPGGGYSILAWDLEGTEVAEWLNSLGVTAVVLKYRVPKRPDDPKNLLPLQDAQRAISLVRSKASEWKLDPAKIGMLGFSAGGNLTAKTATQFDTRRYPAIDKVDEVNCRPDFAVLIYPAYLVEKDNPTKLVADLPISDKTPPLFFAHAGDDGVIPENSVQMYLALKKANVPAELHIYPTGGHGYGLRPNGHDVTTWPARCGEWMKGRGILGK